MSAFTVYELEVLKQALTSTDLYDHDLAAKIWIMQREIIKQASEKKVA
jgi:hypothetical protein